MPLGKNLPPNPRAKNRMPENWAAAIVAILLLFFFHGRAFSQCSLAWPECGPGPGLPDGPGCRMTQNLTLAGGTVDKFIEICGDGLTLNGNGAKITGPVILQSRSGVTINNLTDPSFTWQSSSNNTITGCTGVLYVSMDASSNFNSVLANNALAAGSYIGLAGSNNSVLNNSFNSNPSTVVIDIFQGSMNNLIQGNTINGPAQGISIGANADSNTVTNNRFVGNAAGVWIGGSHNNQVRWNSFQNCVKGVAIYALGNYPATGNLIAEDTMENCTEQGVWIFNARNNTVIRNMVRNNQVGIMEDGILVDSNLIINNNIITNTANQGLGNSDFWDDAVCGGNYWSDYDEPAEGCMDADSNGICDAPRPSPPDSFPFVNQDGWLNPLAKAAFVTSPCFQNPVPNLHLVPIQSVLVRPQNAGNPFPLVAGKNLVVRAFFDTGPNGATTRAKATLCVDFEDCTVPVLKVDTTDSVFPAGRVFTDAERKQGKNSLNLILQGEKANGLLDPGQHTLHVKIEPVNPGEFPVTKDSIRCDFRPGKTPGALIVNMVFPIMINDTAPDVEGAADRQLLDSASNLMRAVYPLDEENVFNVVMHRLPFVANLPFLDSDYEKLIRLLERWRRWGRFKAKEIFATGVVNTIVSGIRPFEGRGGYTIPAIGRSVATLDRKSVPPDSGAPIIAGTVAHEIGHLLGLGDEYARRGSYQDSNPPHPNYTDGMGGPGGWYILEEDTAFDVGGILSPTRRPSPVFDVPHPPDPANATYGYMGAAYPDGRKWTRAREYRILYDSLTKPNTFNFRAFALQTPREVAAITGRITKTDSVKFDPLIRWMSDDPLEPLPAGGPYRLEFRDEAGSLLSAFDFGLDFSIEFKEDSVYFDTLENALFSFMVEMPAVARSLVLLKNGLPMDSLVKSANAPVVNLTSVKPLGGGIEVKWQGTDSDEDSLSYTIFYSSETTAQFPVGIDLRDTVLQINFEGSLNPPQSPVLLTQSSVTIYASDGFNYATDTAPVAGLLGDLNLSGDLTPADVVLELNCVFLGTGYCSLAVADVNCSGDLTPADVVLELLAVFSGQPFPCQ